MERIDDDLQGRQHEVVFAQNSQQCLIEACAGLHDVGWACESPEHTVDLQDRLVKVAGECRCGQYFGKLEPLSAVKTEEPVPVWVVLGLQLCAPYTAFQLWYSTACKAVDCKPCCLAWSMSGSCMYQGLIA